MLVRRLLSTYSTCGLLGLMVCGFPRPAEASASNSATTVLASAAPAPMQTPAPPKSLAPASVTRTKQEAQKLADVIQLQVEAGADVETLALKYSDDPNVKTKHGKLAKMGRNQMDRAFTGYAFALLKFETGPVPLDSPAGLEIIRRME